MAICNRNAAVFAGSNALYVALNSVCHLHQQKQSRREEDNHTWWSVKHNNIIRKYITDESQDQNTYALTFLSSAQLLQNCFALCFKPFK